MNKSIFNNNINKVFFLIQKKGLVKVIPEIVYKGFIRPLEARYSYLIYHRIFNKYPQNIVFIAGFAKSGSSWLTNLLSDLPGFKKLTPAKWQLHESDLYENIFSKEFKKKLVVFKHHTWGHKNNVEILDKHLSKYLITIRDPRDMIISSYYYIKNHPEHKKYRMIIDKKMDVQNFIDFHLESNAFENDIIQWLRLWYKNRNSKKSIIIRYEDLLKNTFMEIKRCVEFYNFKVSDSEILFAVKKNTFEKISGRDKGHEDTKSFYRKGVSGEWKDVFTIKQKEKFSLLADDFLTQLGYEKTI